MKNVQRAAVILVSAGLAATGLITSASAEEAGSNAAMQEASQVESTTSEEAAPQAWPVFAARIAYLGAKHAASTPAVRAQYSNALRAAGGVFAAPAFTPGSAKSASVDVIFDRRAVNLVSAGIAAAS